MNKARRNIRAIKVCLVIGLMVIGNCALAEAKAYDGIWFMGFKTGQGVFKDRGVREAAAAVIDKEYIVREIVSDETVPVGVIPPGMLGYDPDLEPILRDIKYAKLLMKKAGYAMNDPRIKDLSLLHTDGLKTIEIAKKIQQDLSNIGMKVKLVEVSYADENKWVTELASGKHDLYLLGYKAGYQNLFTSEAGAVTIDSADLVGPLFRSDGEANFTGYANTDVDSLLDQVSGFNLALKSERHAKLKQVNQILSKDLPVVVLFYIEKL